MLILFFVAAFCFVPASQAQGDGKYSMESIHLVVLQNFFSVIQTHDIIKLHQ